jgi:hypothetical protein
MGSLLNLTWQYTPASAIDVVVQVKLFGDINTTFTIPKGITSGTVPITLYDNSGSTSVQQTDIQLIALETGVVSNVKTITNITNVDNLVSSITNGEVSINATTPFIVIKNSEVLPLSTISKIDIKIDDKLDNKFYVKYQNISDNTSISGYNVIFKNIDITKDIVFIHSALPASDAQHFTNVKFGLRKKYIEHFEATTITPNQTNVNNQLHIDNITFNFSSITQNVNKYVSLISTFTDYYAIYISTLTINMGTTVLDDYKFNLDFNGTFVTDTTKFFITTINVYGNLSTKIFFVKPIPGLQTVNYIDSTGAVTPLVYSNGYYEIPENYSAVIPHSVPPEDNSLPWWVYLIIVFIILIIIGVIVYFTMKKKDN